MSRVADGSEAMPFPIEVGMCFMWNGDPDTVPNGFAAMDGGVHNGFQTTVLTYYTPVHSNEPAGTKLTSTVSKGNLYVATDDAEHNHTPTGQKTFSGDWDDYSGHTHDASNLKMPQDFDQPQTYKNLMALNSNSNQYNMSHLGNIINSKNVSGESGSDPHRHIASIEHTISEGEHDHDIDYRTSNTDERYRFRPRRFYVSWIVFVGYE